MMKKNFFVFFVLVIGFAAGFNYPSLKNHFKKQKDSPYRIAKKNHPILGNKPFVIVTMSYNNSPYVEKNLLSTLSQNYDNYRIIYIDDASTDGTGGKVENWLKHHDKKKRVSLIQNETNLGAMENLYRAVHQCGSDEIVVIVDGDDFLAHNNVLSELNAYYANPDVWITYGDFLEYPSYAKGKERAYGESRPVNLKIQKERGIRKHAYVSSHLRTFYAGLFQRIKLQDFLRSGEFLKSACDVASMLPMLELAGDHAYYIPEIFYLYNVENPNNDFKKDLTAQESIDKYIRNLSSYKPLTDYPWRPFADENEQVDLVVFSYDRPLQLLAFLESADKYLLNLHRLCVIYRASQDNFEQGYQKVKEIYPKVIYYKQSNETPYKDFAPLVKKAVFGEDRGIVRYVTFAVDDIVIKDTIDFQKSIFELKRTGAYGFYFRLGKRVDYCYMGDFDQGIPSSITLKDGLYAWQFSSGQGDWRYPNTLDMALYCKEDIYPYFVCMKFHNPNILEALWNEHANLSQVGLYYEDTRIVNLPLNIVMENEWINERISNVSTKDLLRLFEQGLKMNIEPLHQIDNHSVHIDYQPEFVQR